MGCKHLRLYYGNRCCKNIVIFFQRQIQAKKRFENKTDGESMSFIKELSSYAIPALIFVILSAGIYKGVKCMTFFWRGKGRITTVLRIIPPLVGLMVAVGVFRASGALDLLVFAVRPAADFLRIPTEALPWFSSSYFRECIFGNAVRHIQNVWAGLFCRTPGVNFHGFH